MREVSEYSMPISNVMSNFTFKVNITGIKVMKIRMWVASKLFLLAARIIGCGVIVQDDDRGVSLSLKQ